MKNYEDLSDYDLLASICVVKTEFGGRKGPVFDGYRGQFFWHINDVNCSDWDAIYIFERGSSNPGEESKLKIMLSENLKAYSKGDFRNGRQFGIREGSRIIAVGVILDSKVNNAHVEEQRNR
jgi:translation elongation factor EF-Tu-like GTPase